MAPSAVNNYRGDRFFVKTIKAIALLTSKKHAEFHNEFGELVLAWILVKDFVLKTELVLKLLIIRSRSVES